MANGNTLIAMLYLPWQNLNTCTPSWHPWFDILQLSHISNPQYLFSQALEPQTLPGESYMGSSSLWAPFQGFAILKGSYMGSLPNSLFGFIFRVLVFFLWVPFSPVCRFPTLSHILGHIHRSPIHSGCARDNRIRIHFWNDLFSVWSMYTHTQLQ